MSTLSQKKIYRLYLLLTGIVFSMFAFGYALVPLYSVLCKTWGINGKTSNQKIAASTFVDASRQVTVLFLANTNAHIPWEFKPMVTRMLLHPGENGHLAYWAKNLSTKNMTIQAIPSVVPGRAAHYLKKTECFCFTQQKFKNGQGMQMPLIFHIDPELPRDIHNIVLSYTLFDVTPHQ